ncbi:MAG: IS21 family transposase [bacterium]|nr:IS21 family transposase [bacterium]
MAQSRLSMRKTLEVLRLKHELHLAERAIAASCGIARSTVQDTLKRFGAAQLSWPLPGDLDEAALVERLYPPAIRAAPVPLPDFAAIQAELARKGVTLLLLWQEYKAQHPDGLQYSAFCDRYAAYRQSRDVVLRQTYRPGEKLFIDFAGPSMPITDRLTGEIKPASIFVAVLGYSNYTFACATAGQTTADWLGGQRAALEFIDGVPQVIVPDNPKAIVTRACRYEPDLNPAYQDFARHYGTAVIPARVRRPRDKAKVEGGVLIIERWILARLRHAVFFSLAELNAAIAELIDELNARAFKKLPGNRYSRFINEERAHLQPLPAKPYEFATWKKARVHLDYHVEIDKRYYSAPYALIGKSVDARLTVRMVELFCRGRLVASHIRGAQPGRFTTLDEHRPPKHRAVIELNHERLRERACAVGAATAEIINRQWRAKLHPEQTLRRSLGILRLARDFTPARLEAACKRALQLGVLSYRAIRGLIDADTAVSSRLPVQAELIAHDNLRGPTYFR